MTEKTHTGKLEVADKAHGLVLSVYKVTANFPSYEQFGLISQMRRAAVSIPANLYEGKARGSDIELCRYIRIARGSLAELRYFFILANDLGYLNKLGFATIESQAEEVARMMGALLEKVLREVAVRSNKHARSPKS